MVNSVKFSERLEKILEHYDLSAAAFADAIDVGRSSISHILSGRNKPSLDFVLKIVQAFPEVELYWLLNGKGKFPASRENMNNFSGPSGVNLFSEEEKKEVPTINNPSIGANSSRANIPAKHSAGKKIKKIVIFYEDGTFDAFEN
ncbi:helix-turn-helix transcriptional regulator [soil metagenome]